MMDSGIERMNQSTSEKNEDVDVKLRTILTEDRGFIKFEGCEEELGLRKYIRVSDKGNKEGPGRLDDVLKYLMKEWDLKTPNLLISVTGGAKSFQVKTQQRTAFRRDLIKLARTTDPWIISGGSNTGIMKEVGEAVRDFNVTAASGQSIVAIGIATWGVVQNRKCLKSSISGTTMKPTSGVEDLSLSRSYKIEHFTNKDETFLNPNHTHFILVDDGSEHKFGKEIAFRAEIENAVANLKTNTGKDAVSVPVVLLVVEGGPNTIETVQNAVIKHTPTVVVKGSGKAADIIAYAYEHTREVIEISKETGRKRPVSKFDDSLMATIKEMIEEEKWGGINVEHVCKNVEVCVKERDLITVFDITATSEMSQGIDISILKALMKVKRDSSLSQLKLALCWNRIDIANSEIIRYMNRQSLEAALGDNEMIMSALGLNRVDFMDLFLENGVDINKFLTEKRLKQLYQEVPASSILKTFIRKKQLKIELKSDECLYEVGKLINRLLGDFYQVLPVYKKPKENASSNSLMENLNQRSLSPGRGQKSVSENNEHGPHLKVVKETQNGNGPGNLPETSPMRHAFQNKVNFSDDPTETKSSGISRMRSVYRNILTKGALEGIHKFENSYLHLFLWCVLTNRQRMAKLFWKYGKDHIAAALVAHGLLKAMANGIGDKEAEKKLKQNSDEFCQLAVKILNECQEKDEKKATDLLTQRLEEWGGTTCEQIAMKTDNKLFVAHATFQSLLSSMWMGELSPLNGLTWILVCIIPLLQPLILKVIRFKVEDEQEQIQSQQIAEPHTRSDDLQHSTSKAVTDDLPTVSNFQKVSYFYEAPVVKFVQNFISYVVFLMLFSYALLSRFDSNVSGVEVTLFVWVFSLFAEEANQWLSCNETYLLNKLNFFDLTPIGLFTIGVICMFVPGGTTNLEVGRIFFSFSFIGFFLRLLGLFSVHKDLGPKLVMISKMFVDLISFMAILMVFVVSYSIAAHAILYPTSKFDGNLIFNLFRIPYWNLYGELILEEMEIKEPDCSYNPVLYENDTLPRCPTTIGGYVVPILMGFYMMIANILLLNLLIAMFSNTFEKVQANSDLYWCFQRFTLIYDYSCRPALPPPFILICHLAKFLVWFYWKSRGMCRCCKKCCKDCTYKDTSIFGWDRDKGTALTQWEKIVTDEYLYRKTQPSGGEGSEKNRTIDAKLEKLLAKHQEVFEYQIPRSNTAEGTKVKKAKLHFLSRACIYPSTNVRRFLVPDEFVPWKAKYPEYEPKLVDLQCEPSKGLKKEADMSSLNDGATPTFNDFDKDYQIDRRSVLGDYKVKSGFPQNPVGRTGVFGLGCLKAWGPNHENRLIVLRWMYDANKKKMFRKRKPMFQFTSWHKTIDSDWKIHQVQDMEPCSISVLPDSFPKALDQPNDLLNTMFREGHEVHRGYVDSAKNTDNAWVEMTIKAYLDENQSLQQFCDHNNLLFKDGDKLQVAVWQTASSQSLIDTQLHICLKTIAKRIGASF